jgi:hypothetical protein
MADQTGHESDDADLKEHLKTWNGFLKLIKWQIIGTIVIMIFLVIFRTHN